MQKEKLIYICLALIIAVLLFLDGGFSFSGKNVSKIYNLSELKLTRIDLPCEVYITRGENEKLVVEAPKDVLDRLDINQNNGILSIGSETGGFNLLGFIKRTLNLSDEVKIYINHSQLDRIIVNNQATIISVDYKKPTYFQANSLKDEDQTTTYFRLVNFDNLKQQLVKHVVKKTIFKIYASF